MDWLQDRACIRLLREIKEAEPPMSNAHDHELWQHQYDWFKEKALGFIKLRAAGFVEDPETVFFAVMLFRRVNDFSDRALRFLRVKDVETLGMAERPAETEVVIGDPDA